MLYLVIGKCKLKICHVVGIAVVLDIGQVSIEDWIQSGQFVERTQLLSQHSSQQYGGKLYVNANSLVDSLGQHASHELEQREVVGMDKRGVGWVEKMV